MSHKSSPTSLRYLKAKLRILKRPSVWGSAAGLFMAIVLFYYYWSRSERFALENPSTSSPAVASLESLPDQGSNSLTPQENGSIGIDIDSIPVLLNDFALNEEASSNTPAPSGQENSSAPRSNTGNASTPPSVTPPTSDSSFLDLNLPDPALLSSVDTGQPTSTNLNAAPVYGSTPSAQTTATQTPNSLRDALQRYSTSTNDSGQTTASSSSSLSAGTTPPSDGRLQAPPLVPSQALPTQGLSNRSQLQPYQTSPPPGSTGYTMPPALRNNPSSPYFNTGYPSNYPGLPAPQIAPPSASFPRGQTTPLPTYGSNSGYGANSSSPYPTVPQYQQPITQPSPFSVPRNIPGRPIGNGEINTFSNP